MRVIYDAQGDSPGQARQRVPVKVWASILEEQAEEQLRNLASLPFIFHHVAAMPDVHKGYGATIGSVFATRDVVLPMAVGVDIGCGMAAVRTNLLAEEVETGLLREIHHNIKRGTPVGQNSHKAPRLWEGFAQVADSPDEIRRAVESHARYQIGTLGGGNHFIEIQKDPEGHLWIMLHSGSRHIGKVIAEHYHRQAKAECARYYVETPQDLQFLPTDSEAGKAYIKHLLWAQDYAMQNRRSMLDQVLHDVAYTVEKRIGKALEAVPPYEGAAPMTDLNRHDTFDGKVINIHHNFAQLEHHYGHNVWVHRKGATPARLGQLGLIPGSMGTATYVVRGKGNPESFSSCSHGAGRLLGRNAARQALSNDEVQKAMADIVWDAGRIEDLKDEAPQAYKDIDEVMKEQADLVDPVVRLVPLAVVKG